MLSSRNFIPQLVLLENFFIKPRCFFQTMHIKFPNERIIRKYSTNSNTLNDAEVHKFGEMASLWWSKTFLPLRNMDACRVPLIRDGLLSSSSHTFTNSAKPLTGFKILDVGCGGGLLSESLARLGASVTGLDPATEMIEIASEHAKLDQELGSNLTYICDTVEKYKHKVEPFDAVVCSEVVEHVDNVPYFVQCCTELVKDGGSLFLTTINRTSLSYVAAIIGAEYVLGIVPKGTHQWSMFIKPEELQGMVEKYGCRVVSVQGMSFNPLTYQWSWSSIQGVNYALHAIKET